MPKPLSTDNEAFIADAVARGVYRSRDEAIDAGVDMLRRHELLLARIDEGRRQLDEGEYLDYDEAGLKELAEELKVRARSAARHE